MTILEIITKDLKNNHIGTKLEEAIESYNVYASNNSVYRIRNTLFLVKGFIDGELYFHIANADSYKEFIENYMQFFSGIDSNKCPTAITYFDHSRVGKLFKFSYGTAEKLPIDDPSGFLYRGIVNIKAFNGMG